jgi:hypothetical protein
VEVDGVCACSAYISGSTSGFKGILPHQNTSEYSCVTFSVAKFGVRKNKDAILFSPAMSKVTLRYGDIKNRDAMICSSSRLSVTVRCWRFLSKMISPPQSSRRMSSDFVVIAE